MHKQLTASLLAILFCSPVLAAPVFEIEIQDHLFYPAELEVPAHTTVKLHVLNSDDTVEEFKSYELNREKILPPASKSVIYIGPLNPGDYPFYGEFFPRTAQGVIIAR